MKCCNARGDAHFHWCQQVGGRGFSEHQLRCVVEAERAARCRGDREAARMKDARELAERVARQAGRPITPGMIDRAVGLLLGRTPTTT